MSLYEKLKGIDQKFSWSFFSLVLSVLFFAFGLYTTFLYEKRPKLCFQILSEAPVYSLREEVNKLDVLFEGEDIRKKNQTLTLLALRVINSGSADILKNSFDSEHLPSVTLNDCRVIKVDVIGASSDYLQTASKLIPAAENRYFISPVIIERDEFFDLKFLLLHNEGTKPSVSLNGKLAGVSKLEVVNVYLEKEELTFWRRVFGGNLFIQILRILTYAVGTIMFLVVVAIGSTAIFEKVETSRRNGFVSRFRVGSGLKFTDTDEKVFSEYVRRGEWFLLRLSQLLADPTQLRDLLTERERRPINPNDDAVPTFAIEDPRRFSSFQDHEIVGFILREKLAVKTDSSLEIQHDLPQKIQHFILSLSVLAPKRMQAARGSQASYGTESNPVKNLDTLSASETPAKQK